MNLVLPLAIALITGLAGIALVGIDQTWLAVAVAGVVIVTAAVAVVIAIGRLVEEPPRPGGGRRPAPPARP